MLFGKRVLSYRGLQNIKIVIFLTLISAVILAFTACGAGKGSIIINEKPFGGQFEISFNEWSAQNKCKFSLRKGEDVKVEIIRESGEISLSIRGKNGSEAYMGNDLDTSKFTVKVSETDEYVMQLSGKKATGEIKLTRITE